MPNQNSGDKRSRKVKKRKQRDTRRIIRQVLEGKDEEFSANFVSALIEKEGLSAKCLPDIGQYLKDEARSKVWVVCVKETGTPRYKLIEGGIGDIEKFEVEEVPKSKETTVEQRIEAIESPEEQQETNGFSRAAENVKLFVEAFATVLGNEDAITKDQAKEVLHRAAGFAEDAPINAVGKILSGLFKPTSKRPPLLEHKGQDASGKILVTLSLAGQKVAKGTWALRDSPYGVRVFNFATGCFVDNGELEREARERKRKKAEEAAAPFNPPRIVEQDSQETSQQAPQQPEVPLRVVQDPETLKDGPAPSQTPERARWVASSPVTTIGQRELPSSYGDFYLSRASQRLFDVLVTECHPSDYERVIDMLMAKLTGNIGHSVFKGVSATK